jgi:hypothetical protein
MSFHGLFTNYEDENRVDLARDGGAFFYIDGDEHFCT